MTKYHSFDEFCDIVLNDYTKVPGPLDTPCHISNKKASNHGYARAGYKRQGYLLHRLAATRANSKPYHSNNVVTIHMCDTKLCINPDHLRLGSQTDNYYDSVRKGRAHWQGGAQSAPDAAYRGLE